MLSMKVLSILCLAIIIQQGSSAWLENVFTGLTEPLEEKLEEHKDLWDAVKLKVKDGLKNFKKGNKLIWDVASSKLKDGAEVLKSKGLHELAKKGSDFLKDVEISGSETWQLEKEKLSETKEKVIEHWNKLIEKVKAGDLHMKFKRVVHKFKKLHHKLKHLVPKELFKDMRMEATAALKKWKNKVPTKEIEQLKKQLKDHVKDWKEPRFMGEAMKKVKEQDINKAVKDAAKQVKEHLDEATKKVVKEYTDVAEDVKDKQEEKAEKFVKTFFHKPHHKSGTGRWRGVLDKISEDALKKVDENKRLIESGQRVAKELIKAISGTEGYETDKNPETDPYEEGDDGKEEMNVNEKKEFEKAEEEWEEKVMKETTRLLTKLEPAEAYIIRDTPVETTQPPKRKITGNENWDIYKKYQKKLAEEEQAKEDSFKDYEGDGKVVKPQDDKVAEHKEIKDLRWAAGKAMGKKFTEDIADVTSKWLQMKEDLMKKLDGLDKKIQKKY